MSLLKFWVKSSLDFLNDKPDAYVQIRKMFQNKSISVSWDDFNLGELPTFMQMGYRNEDNKMKQLERNYFNEEELIRIREVFIMRLNSRGNKSVQTCVSARLGNKKKDSRSQGFCMQTITINYLEPKLFIEVHYRSTELTQKFLADLVFLRERVIPFLMEGWPEGIKPDGIIFNFSTCYTSLMFIPVLFQHVNVPEVLIKLKESDPKYYRQVMSSVSKLMDSQCSYNYLTRAKMHELFREEVYPKLNTKSKKIITRLIKEYKK